MKEYKNILLIKMSALGDIIHALPTLYALRQLYPGAKVTWLVEPQFADILPGKPYIDEKIVFYKNDLKKKSFLGKITYLKELRRDLHARQFDLVIDLQGLFKSSLVALLSGCSERIGYCEMREGSFLVTRAIKGANSQGHVIQRYLDVARYLGWRGSEVVFPLPSFAKEEEKIRHLLETKEVSGDFVVFFPASRWITKEWPLTYYARLAGKLAGSNLFVLIAGTAEDREKAKEIKKFTGSDRILDITGRTSIAELAALVKMARVCIGGDTGPLHIAAAAGTPTVSLFGPVSGQRTGAYGQKSVLIKTTALCAPCFKRICPRQFTCMSLIGVDEVFTACEKFLE